MTPEYRVHIVLTVQVDGTNVAGIASLAEQWVRSAQQYGGAYAGQVARAEVTKVWRVPDVKVKP